MGFDAQSRINVGACDLLTRSIGRRTTRKRLDIAYAAHGRQKLDLYVPAVGAEPAPVVVFFYGGSWQGGSKAIYGFLGRVLARRGLVVAIPDYRVYPDVRFPAFLQDAAAAVRWARDHADDHGGDPARIVLMGHSAGAHIAAMLAYDPQWLNAVGLQPRRDISGLIGLAGPYDFLPILGPTLRDIFGPVQGHAATQPINFVDGGGPPALLATGDSDRLVDPGNSLRMAERIRRAGGAATARVYRRLGHRGLIGAFAAPLRPLAPVLRDCLAFIGDVARPSPAHPARRDRRTAA